MTDRERDDASELEHMLRPLRGYHEPGETPREQMWEAIVARIRSGAAEVHPIERARPKLGRPLPWLGWAAAASVVLFIGIAVGRSTAPEATTPPEPSLAAAPGDGASPATTGFDFAVRGHLGRTESLLTGVRSDGRQGRVDPAAAAWAGGLLTQTRLLLVLRQDADPAMVALLEDLELVLAQIVVMAQTGADDGERARTELDLVLQALDAGSVLPRLQAACPAGCTTPEV